MTGPRRVVVVLAALALAGMALYPPWVYKGGTPAGYSWVFNPPPSAVPGDVLAAYIETHRRDPSGQEQLYSGHDPLGLVPDKEWRERYPKAPRPRSMGQDPRPDLARFALQCVALVGVAGAAFFVVSGRRTRERREGA